MTLLIAPQLTKPLCRYGIKHAALFDGASGYLSRTFAGDGGDIWALSMWVHRSTLNSNFQFLLSCPGNPENNLSLYNTDQLALDSGGTYFTSGVYRDPTAWTHLFVTGNGTLSKLYVNGILQTLTGSPNFSAFNAAVAHSIGRYHSGSYFLGGYLAEVHFVSGQELMPSHFGETDEATGQWKAKRYTGPYGANGFHLDFSNAASLGADVSGNGNDWMVNGNVTQVTSTPTNVYATLNPLEVWQNANRGIYGNGNLSYVTTTSYNSRTVSTLEITAKIKCEVLINSGTTVIVGVKFGASEVTYYGATGAVAGVSGSSGATFGIGDRMTLLLDRNAGTIEFKKNNVSQGGVRTITGLGSADVLLFMGGDGTTGGAVNITFNFGATDFAYADAGYDGLCTNNLPARSPKVPSTPQTGTIVCNGTTDNAFIVLGMAPDKSSTSTVNGVTLVWGTNALACATGVKLISAAFNGSLNYSIAVAAYTGGSNIAPATAK